MAAAGNVTLNGNVTGGSDGARSFGPFTITTNAAVASVQTVSLAAAANTITLPTGCTAVVLLPPNAPSPGGTGSAAFSGTLTLKGVTGDTGVAISNKWPTLLGFDTPPGTIVVTSTATGSLVVWAM